MEIDPPQLEAAERYRQGDDVARNHSDQTKQRISEGMKQAHERKKLAQNPTNQRAKQLHDKFQGSTTELISPRIRNYGGIGRDVTTSTPEIKASPAERSVDRWCPNLQRLYCWV